MTASRHYPAWMLTSIVLAIHIADEAGHGFLSFYNPAVLEIRQRERWLILPTFTFPVWIILLALLVLGVLIVSHWVRRGLPWTIYAAYCFAAMMLGNGAGHLVASIYQRAWMPGTYTAPLVLISAIYLAIEAGLASKDNRSRRLLR